MKNINIISTVCFGLALICLNSLTFAQIQTNPNKDSKVTIIEKTIDAKGSETEGKNIIIKQFSNRTATADKPALGVTIEQATAGVKINSVNGAAKEAGLQEGDILQTFNGTIINTVEELQKIVQQQKIGDKVSINYLRNEKKFEATAILKAAEKDIYHVEKRVDYSKRLGREKSCDPCKKLEQLRAEPFIGVYINTESGSAKITDIIENTAAAKSKLKNGDVISKINEAQIGNYDELVSVLKNYKPGQSVKINFDRDGKTEKTRVRLGSLADRDPLYSKKLEECCNAKSKNSNDEKADSPIINNTEIIVELFPNPASEQINVSFNANKDIPVSISINTIEGKEIIQMELKSDQGQYTEQINIDKLPKGIYLMTIKQGKTVLSRQFSKI
jgi:predicted metalloprotease with PDZ domain